MPATQSPPTPPAGPAILVYLCRQCGDKFTAYSVIDGPGMFGSIIKEYGQLVQSPTGPAKLPLCQVHTCPDGRWGVADIIGMTGVGADGGPL